MARTWLPLKVNCGFSLAVLLRHLVVLDAENSAHPAKHARRDRRIRVDVPELVNIALVPDLLLSKSAGLVAQGLERRRP